MVLPVDIQPSPLHRPWVDRWRRHREAMVAPLEAHCNHERLYGEYIRMSFVYYRLTHFLMRSRRIWYLDCQAAALSREMRNGLGAWIRRHHRTGIPRRLKKAHEEFIASGHTRRHLEQQWALQQEAQLSVRARECLNPSPIAVH